MSAPAPETPLDTVDDDRVRLEVGDGQSVAGTLLVPEVPVPGFLFVHGWGGDQADDLSHADGLARLGCVCFTFDLRGHAGSDADRQEVTRAEGLADVCAAYDYLASRPLVDETAIGVVGTSYGGYLAALLTAERPVRWLAMRVPALYPDDHWDMPKARLDKDAVRAYREAPHDGTHDRALAACERFRGDALVVESELDTQVPREAMLSYQRAFRSANSFTHRVVRGATHAMRDEGHRRVYAGMLSRWVDEMVRAGRRTG